jgi:hypothetical protein
LSNARASRLSATRYCRIGGKSFPMLELPAVEISLPSDSPHEFLDRETDTRIQNWLLKHERGLNLGSAKDEWGNQKD